VVQRIQVDYGALDSLANRLDQIRQTLLQTGSHRPPGDVFGDGRLAAEVHHFVDNWSQGRERIEREIEQLSKVVRSAAQAYRDAEQKLVAEMSGSAGGEQ